MAVHDVRQVYGETEALRGVDLAVAPGTIVGLIGPSGCGKSTLVRLVTGIEHPTSGSVQVFGGDPTRFGDAQRSRLGYMPQKPVLFPNLSVWSNLGFVSSLYGLPLRGRRSRLLAALELVDMAHHRHKLLAECSGGMQRRVSLAATLVHDPDLVVLDEPTAGIDPILRERFWSHFRGLRDRGRTLLVPTQYVGEASSCDLVAVMAAGRMLTVQPPHLLAREAFGGHPLLVRLGGGWLPSSEIDRVAALPGVGRVRRHADGLVVGVADARSAAAAVTAHLGTAGIPVESVTDADPTDDDVFVALVESHTSSAERMSA